MKKVFLKVLFLGLAFFLFSASNLIAADFQRYVVAGTQIYLLETDGSLTLAGDVVVDGATTLTGNVAVTGTLGVTGATTQTGALALGAGFTPWLRTLAQIDALTADTTGQLVVCSDCTRSAICISSGSVTSGAFVVLVETGTFAGSTFSGLAHCE